jgi:serine/threonine protein kinase
LQFASHTSIRQYVARQKQVPLSLRLRWVEQLFDAVRFIHSRSVLHGDISCNNVFLDENLDVKLGDFAGSAIDDLPPLVCYETSHELPGEDISTRTELFALGSTVYEIMTGSRPYKDLPDHEVSAAFSEGRYPDLESVSTFRNTIMRCWKQSYTTAEDALRDVKLEGMFDSLAQLQKLIIRIVATLKEPPRYNHIPAQIFGGRGIWAIMPVCFGLHALIPFSNALNVTRLSSTFAVVEGVVDVITHLNNEAQCIRGK